jgi:hypothetical protein
MLLSADSVPAGFDLPAEDQVNVRQLSRRALTVLNWTL